MSNEISKQGNGFLGYTLMPTIQTTAGAAVAIKAHGGISKALKAQNSKAFSGLNKALKKDLKADIFTRSQALARGYDNYKDIAKKSAKATKKAEFASINRFSLKDKIYNHFHPSKKKTAESFANVANEAKETLKSANETLDLTVKNFKDGAQKLDEVLNLGTKDFSKLASRSTQEVVTTGLKGTIKGFGKTVRSNFKHELGLKYGKFNYFMTAAQFLPNISKDIIPAFKEKGFAAGMKEIGKTGVQAVTDLVGYAAGGAVGRAIGSAIGTIIRPGAGSKIGGAIGDCIGSLFVGGNLTNFVDKLLGKDKQQEVANMPEMNQTTYPMTQVAVNQPQPMQFGMQPNMMPYAQQYPQQMQQYPRQNGYYA